MPATLRKTAESKMRRATAANGATVLSPLEAEFVGFFVGVARALKAPKSLGEIYGLLFGAVEPLPFDEIVLRLRISRGSASQGLRLLRGFGAVRVAYVPGDRRDHFAAETELRKLANGFLKERIEPQVAAGTERLERVESALARLPAALRRGEGHEVLRGRIKKLRAWEDTVRGALPLLARVLAN